MADEAIPASENPIVEDAETSTTDDQASSKSEEQAPVVPSFKGTKHKVKIDDNEQEIDYDELVRGYQISSAGQKKLREAAQIRQQVDKVIEALQSGDHKKFVGLVGKEAATKIANDFLLEEIDYESLPEHEKTIRQLKSEKEKYEAELKAQKDAQESAENQRRYNEEAQKIETEIVGAITSNGVKPTKRIVARVAELMEANYLQTGEPLSAAKAFEYMVSDSEQEITDYLNGMSEQQFLEFAKKKLPKKYLDTLRADDVATVLSQTNIGQGRTDKQDLPQTRKSGKVRTSTDDWFNKMEKRFSGG